MGGKLCFYDSTDSVIFLSNSSSGYHWQLYQYSSTQINPITCLPIYQRVTIRDLNFVGAKCKMLSYNSTKQESVQLQ